MKRQPFDISKVVPVGFDAEGEKSGIVFGMFGAVIFSFFVFAIRLGSARSNLFEENVQTGEKVLIESRNMADFGDVLAFAMAGFFVLIFSMVLVAYRHYNYHFQGSKSIYLMKRVPDKWEFPRRCFALPLAVTALSLVTAFVLTVIYYWIYMAVTPEPCLVPGQWQKFWSFNWIF